MRISAKMLTLLACLSTGMLFSSGCMKFGYAYLADLLANITTVPLQTFLTGLTT